MWVNFSKYLVVFICFTASASWANFDLGDEQFPENPFLALQHDVVLNGTKVSSQSALASFTVLLEITDLKTKATSFCTGIIIAQDMILTAGHCFKDYNKKVKVLFGSGGTTGFSHSVTSRQYLYVYNKVSKATYNPWRKDYLSYDKISKKNFDSEVASRTSFKNQNPGFNNFNDYALVKIPKIPAGYAPIPYYKGSAPKLRQSVYVLGYGTNSRYQDQQNDQLNFAKMQVIDQSVTQGRVIGWQIYDNKDNAAVCFGDSGGPLVVYTKAGYQLLGVNVFVYNACANSGWSVNPRFFQKQIEQMAKDLRRTSLT